MISSFHVDKVSAICSRIYVAIASESPMNLGVVLIQGLEGPQNLAQTYNIQS